MKKPHIVFTLLAFIGLFFGCESKLSSLPPCEGEHCEDNYSSSNESEVSSSSSGGTATISSSSSRLSSSSSSITASSSSRVASSSSVVSSSSVFVSPYSSLAQGQSGVSTGWASRYWDGCKPSCSWSDKPQAISGSRCKACSSNGTSEIAANDNNRSSCDGGNSYTCFDQVPYIVNENLAYAFAATPGSGNQCGKCYQIQFDGGFEHGTAYATHNAIKGKTLIVMSSNIGGDVSGGQFDLMIPGGGLGQFDAFSPQIGVNKSDLGAQYGGLLANCETQLNWANGTLAQYQTCLRDKCNSVFGSKNANLLNGCLFYANWAMAANNPKLLYKEVTCPQYLIDKYKASML